MGEYSRPLQCLTLLAAFAGAQLMYGAVANAESTYDKIKREGVFKAGVKFDFPPIGYVDAQGKLVGFGPDIAKALADKLGVKLELIQETSQTRVPLLLNGNTDAAIDALTPTVKRNEVLDFSIVYWWGEATFITQAGASTKAADYGKPPKVVCFVQGGNLPNIWLKLYPETKSITLQTTTECNTAVLQKKVDAALTDKFVAIVVQKQYPDKIAIGEGYFKDPIAIAVRQNDSKWLNWINWTLQELWHEGTYQKLYEKNIGQKPDFHLWSPYGLQPGIGEK